MSGPIDLAKDTIRRGKVDILQAQYVSGGSKCGELQTTDQDAMCEYLDTLEGSLTGDVRITLRSSKVDRKRGAKPVADQPYEYVIKCGRGRPAAVPPAVSTSTAPLQSLPMDVVHKSGVNEARAQTLEERVAEMAERIADLEAELDEADEEAEAIHETLNAAPPPPPLPWHSTEAGATALIKLFQPISDAAAAFMMNGFKRPTGAPPANRTAQVDAPTQDELRLLAAARNFRRENPEQAEIALKGLMENYAATDPDPDAAV